MTKIAIVTSEGGMSCAYTLGVILGLVEHYKLTDPDLVIGSSGSTGILSYFVAQQYAQIKNIWENLLSNKQFVSKSRINKIMDIDYLIDEVFKKQEPLNVQAIKDSKIKLMIAATNMENGEVKYFSNHDDIFEALRASSAIPFYYSRKVKIGNQRFVDGAIEASFEKNILKARELGADKIIAINSSNDSLSSRIFLRVYCFLNHLPYEPISYRADKNTLLIKPSRKLPVTGAIDNTRQHLIESIRIGYEDVLNNKELAQFLKISN